jgi:hypothetical protein
MGKITPAVPDALPIREALAQHQGLASLTARLRASEQRMQVVRALLPAPLARQLRAGTLDEAGWTLLAPNAAIASKLRHFLPDLCLALRQQGLDVSAIRVKLQGRN